MVFPLVASLVWHDAAKAAPKHTETAHFVIEYDGIPDDILAFVERDAEQAYQDVTGYLHITFSRKIHIEIGNQYPQPVALDDAATLRFPANRLMPTGAQVGQEQIRGRGVTFWHAVAAIVYPSRQQPEGFARFLTHGLGAYLQWKFGNKRPAPWPSDAYPNMGEDLHPATAKLAAQIGFLSLNDAVREFNDRRLTRGRQLGWLEAASFVEYLLETRPLDRFERWYDGGRFKDDYGTDLSPVEADWKTYVTGLK